MGLQTLRQILAVTDHRRMIFLWAHRRFHCHGHFPMALPKGKTGVASVYGKVMTSISETYVQSLLWQSAPGPAVETLSQFWSHRADPTLVCFGLSGPEYDVTLAQIYLGEVGNGGHLKYFLNRGFSPVPDTILALHRIDLPRLGEILQSMVQRVSAHDISRLPTDVLEQMTMADQAVWACFEVVDEALLTYLRRVSDQILRPERGL